MSGLLRLLDIDDSADLHPLLYTQETSPLRCRTRGAAATPRKRHRYTRGRSGRSDER